MTMNAQSPAARGVRSLEFGNAVQANSAFRDTAPTLSHQDEFSPAVWLAARFRIPLPTAKLHAELNRFGGAKW